MADSLGFHGIADSLLRHITVPLRSLADLLVPNPTNQKSRPRVAGLKAMRRGGDALHRKTTYTLMRYAIVRIGDLDQGCDSWLAGVTSDASAARRWADDANLTFSTTSEYRVFVIPDEDFVCDSLKTDAVDGVAAQIARDADRVERRKAARVKAAEAAVKKAARKAAKGANAVVAE